MIGVLGDVHGRFDPLFKIFETHPEITRWFQVGDLGAEDIPYPEFPSNFHFIQGNHENWDAIALLKDKENPLFLRNGDVRSYRDGGRSYTVGALGGNYSSNFYDKKSRDLSGDRRRHFVAQEVESLKIWQPKVDVLLTHEAPVPFRKGGREMGQPVINSVIEKITPDVHFFGHHHYYRMLELGGTVSVGLEYAGQSYVLYDIDSGRVERMLLA
jgi:uncharacterized protein